MYFYETDVVPPEVVINKAVDKLIEAYWYHRCGMVLTAASILEEVIAEVVIEEPAGS